MLSFPLAIWLSTQEETLTLKVHQAARVTRLRIATLSKIRTAAQNLSEFRFGFQFSE